jgi:stearoyl-CoA desaturase (Delta-9 desaturase)
MPPIPRKDIHDVMVSDPSKSSMEDISSMTSNSDNIHDPKSDAGKNTMPLNPVPFINIPFGEFTKAAIVMGLVTSLFHHFGQFHSNYWMTIYLVCQIGEMISPATLNLVQYIFPPALIVYTSLNEGGFHPSWAQMIAFMPTVLFLIGVPMSVCLHRYFSHSAFTTTRFGQFLVAVVSTFAYQGGCLWWAAKHIRHHHYCDQPKDPHSVVQQGFFYAFCGWTMNPINLSERETHYLDNRLLVPELYFLDKCYLLPVALMCTYLEHMGYARAFIASSILLPMLFCRLITLLFNVEYHPAHDPKRCKSVDNPRLLALIVGESQHDLHHKSPAKSRRNDWDLACTFLNFWFLTIIVQYHFMIGLTYCSRFKDWISLSWMEAFGLVWDLR